MVLAANFVEEVVHVGLGRIAVAVLADRKRTQVGQMVREEYSGDILENSLCLDSVVDEVDGPLAEGC